MSDRGSSKAFVVLHGSPRHANAPEDGAAFAHHSGLWTPGELVLTLAGRPTRGTPRRMAAEAEIVGALVAAVAPESASAWHLVVGDACPTIAFALGRTMARRGVRPEQCSIWQVTPEGDLAELERAPHCLWEAGRVLIDAPPNVRGARGAVPMSLGAVALEWVSTVLGNDAGLDVLIGERSAAIALYLGLRWPRGGRPVSCYEPDPAGGFWLAHTFDKAIRGAALLGEPRGIDHALGAAS